MPTELHDAYQRWAIGALVEWTQDGLVSREEQRGLDAGVGMSKFFPLSGEFDMLTIDSSL